MNTSLLAPIIAATNGESAPIMLKIIFWVFLALWAFGGFMWSDNPRWAHGHSIVVAVCLAILGFYVFGF